MLLQILGDIEKMEEYRRALYAIKTRLIELRRHRVTDDNLIKLLQEGKIQQFNERRSELKITHPDSTDAKLSNASLPCADLTYTDLSYTDLHVVNLSYANLSGAKLSKADLDADVQEGLVYPTD